jgi:hypothetical protein
MREFIKEYWLWILAPMVLVGLAVVFMIAFTGPDDGSAPFIYSLF